MQRLTTSEAAEFPVLASMRTICYDEREVNKVLEAYAPLTGTDADASEPRMIADELVSREQQASSPQPARDASNLTDTEPGAGDRARREGGNR
ncbi:MAG TPA: hypothetical protein VJS44_15920 [Pyrinomonadaceae bacterium]|nr:hypothetical protein [Pyrinomonadaceae bacterium]